MANIYSANFDKYILSKVNSIFYIKNSGLGYSYSATFANKYETIVRHTASPTILLEIVI